MPVQVRFSMAMSWGGTPAASCCLTDRLSCLVQRFPGISALTRQAGRLNLRAQNSAHFTGAQRANTSPDILMYNTVVGVAMGLTQL